MKRMICLSVLLAAVSSVSADVALHPLFADHAVLQRDRELIVAGTASPGEAVSIELAGKTAKTTANEQGTWSATLPALTAGGPYEMTVRGNNAVTLKDIYVGEVWIASGQSNMDFSLSSKDRKWAGVENEEAEIAAANHPMIREFRVPLMTEDLPQTNLPAKWAVCSPETVGDFSAAGYFFAKELQASQKVAVGIVTSAYGASTAQAWISREKLLATPDLASMIADYDKAKAEFADGTAEKKYVAATQAWDEASAKAKAEGKPAPRKPGPPKDPTKDQHSPTVCYNAMIAPLSPLKFRGVIWYQGESNGYNHPLYLKLMTALITDWRDRAGEEFPFISTQLAGYKAPTTQPVASSQIASVREAQRLTMTTLKNAPTITAFDIGDEKNVHPKNKQEVGRRLALAARATVYGESVDWSGPQLDRATIVGDAVRITFTHNVGLATRHGEALGGFTIRDNDETWHHATATLDGDVVQIAIPAGVHPTEVRYAWADNPTSANLINRAGLPALPFRIELSSATPTAK